MADEQNNAPQPPPAAPAPPAAATDPAPAWEAELDVYPLRRPEEDPRWAVGTVKVWVWFTFACIVFILVLIILGIWYD